MASKALENVREPPNKGLQDPSPFLRGLVLSEDVSVVRRSLSVLQADVWEMRHVFCGERSKVADSSRLALFPDVPGEIHFIPSREHWKAQDKEGEGSRVMGQNLLFAGPLVHTNPFICVCW